LVVDGSNERRRLSYCTYSPLVLWPWPLSRPSSQVTAGVQMELGSTTQFAFQDQDCESMFLHDWMGATGANGRLPESIHEHFVASCLLTFLTKSDVYAKTCSPSRSCTVFMQQHGIRPLVLTAFQRTDAPLHPQQRCECITATSH
jgi:hypothetical protein